MRNPAWLSYLSQSIAQELEEASELILMHAWGCAAIEKQVTQAAAMGQTKGYKYMPYIPAHQQERQGL